MSLFKILCLVIFGLFISFGQVMFKLASTQPKDSTFGLLGLLLNRYFVSGIVVYALCTVFWLWIIRDIPLNKAYPFVAITFILVPLMSWMVLGETLSIRVLLGSVVLVLGIVLTVS